MKAVADPAVPPAPSPLGELLIRTLELGVVLTFVFWCWSILGAVLTLPLSVAYEQWPIQLPLAFVIYVVTSWALIKALARKTKLPIWIFGSGGAIYLLLIVVGTVHGRDILIGALAIALTYLFIWLCPKSFKARWLGTAPIAIQLLGTLASIVIFWLLTICIPTDNTIPLRATRSRLAPSDAWNGVRVGVALSGGGYRAALVHAGVIDTLEYLRVPITNVSAVSGGSIIGTFYAAGGSPASFAAGVSDGHFNLLRWIIFSTYFLRLPFGMQIPGSDIALPPSSWGITRTEMQVSLLDDVIFRNMSLGQIHQYRNDTWPDIAIGATDLETGKLVGITSAGVFSLPPLTASDRLGFRTDNVKESFRGEFNRSSPTEFPASESVARLVAASGAFPLVFPPIRIERPSGRPWLLADGGLLDNSGLVLFQGLASLLDEWKVDLIISSDASVVFEDKSVQRAEAQLLRAIDVMYTSVGMSAVRSNLIPAALLSPAAIFGSPSEPGVSIAHLELRRALREGRPIELSIAANRIIRQISQPLGSSEGDEFTPDRTVVGEDQIYRMAVDLNGAVKAFVSASTLKSSFSSQEAHQLFRLGQYIALLKYEKLLEWAQRGAAYRFDLQKRREEMLQLEEIRRRSNNLKLVRDEESQIRIKVEIAKATEMDPDFAKIFYSQDFNLWRMRQTGKLRARIEADRAEEVVAAIAVYKRQMRSH